MQLREGLQKIALAASTEFKDLLRREPPILRGGIRLPSTNPPWTSITPPTEENLRSVLKWVIEKIESEKQLKK
jgi:hypothetical protein